MKRRHSAPRRKPKFGDSEPSGSLPIGAEFTGVIRDLTVDGNGVVQHHDGQIFFVPGVWIGEQARVRVTGFKGRFGFAEMIAIEDASPHRLTPPCPYQGHTTNACGGCPWQFVSYAAQLQAKQDRVRQTLGRIATAETIRPILPSPNVYGYRNRTQFKTDGEQLGYMAAASRSLVDVRDCLILTEKNRNTLQALRNRLPQSEWRPRRSNTLTTLDIDETVDASSVSVNARLPFQQANGAQNQNMRRWLIEKLAGFDRAQPVLELFAGSGNFTEVILDAGFNKVVAVEAVEKAMTELQQKFPAIKTLTCDLFAADACDRLYHAMPDAEILVLDPPRDGLKNDLLKSKQGLFRKKSTLKEVLYISCNLPTLSRDLHAFIEHGYKVVEVQPLDQFPHTPHIELMVQLRC